MSVENLVLGDLFSLSKLADDLDFNDMERQSALLENRSRDFNAVPGSGKTSLLAAKLMLLASKWSHSRTGICVLSHTNVAKSEITRRLATTQMGARLLSYPHFIGTIHGFVNHFVALPMMRSLNLKVDVIDNDLFAERVDFKLQSKAYSKLRFFLEKRRNGDWIAKSLFYKSSSLTLASEVGTLPATHTSSYKLLVNLKEELSNQGVFRHRDIFAYAALAIKNFPHLLDVLHRRFPMVFIDEMQDTSWEQEDILNQLFEGKSVVQRFGDIDQKILSDEDNSDRLTFPREGYGLISTSKRFGRAIASAIESVRLNGGGVVGDGEDGHAPLLILYKSADITKVIPFFGRIVCERLSTGNYTQGVVKAICARVTGDGDVEPGRMITDYWPSYDQKRSNLGGRSDSFWRLIGEAEQANEQTMLTARANDVRRALFLVLRNAKSPTLQGLRNPQAICRALSNYAPEVSIEKLVFDLAISGATYCQNEQRPGLIKRLYDDLKPFLPTAHAYEDFSNLKVFKDKDSPSLPLNLIANVCVVNDESSSLSLKIGTVASVKGETLRATLVLESYGGNSRAFDVSLGLEYIAGIATKPLLSLPKTQRSQMRNLYVAMSRPTTLLCLAANECRVSHSVRDELIKKGWQIENVS